MTIFRNISDKKLYTIDHLILDIKHLNNNADAGVYARPYKWKGEDITYKSKDKDKCNKFILENFIKIAVC